MRALLLAVVAALAAVGWASRRSGRPLLTHLVLLRFPILIGAVLAGFPLAAAGGELFDNLFALDLVGLVAVGALATVAGWVVVATAELALRYGGQRLGSPAAASSAPAAERWIDLALSPRMLAAARRARTWLAAALGAPSIGLALHRSASEGALRASLGLALGICAGVAILFAAMAVEKLLVVRPRDPRVLPDFGGALDGLLTRPTPPAARRLIAWATWLVNRPLLGPGYVEPAPAGGGETKIRTLLPGHLANLCLLGVSLVVYAGIGALQYPGWGAGELAAGTPRELDHLPAAGASAPALLQSWFPAYGYLLLLLIVLGWLLPGLSFLLDRFRIPVLAPAVLLWAIGFSFSGGDHFFAVAPAPAPTPLAAPPAPAAEPALAQRLLGEGGPVVVVAAAGGGITSARWTAEVLTRLAEDERSGAAFVERLAAVSAVSGGALGTLYFVDRLPAPSGRALAPEAGREIRRAAGSSSLDEVAWGLAFPDLVRGAAAPLASALFPRVDRSWALESSWARRLAPAEGRLATLAGWREEVLAGRRPLTVFNATTVETGERFQFSTLLPADRPGVGNFLRDYAGYDLPVVSAVRLAATFPLVTQAARARPVRGASLSGAHFVDGGYYDNSGMLSALELLEDALGSRPAADPAAPTGAAPAIVLVRVRAFETTPAQLAAERGDDPWLVSVLSPMTTVLRVRAATQVYRNVFEAELFRAKWRARGVPVYLVDVPLHAPGPLSWKLTAAERCAIAREWREEWTGRRAEQPCLALLDALLVPAAGGGADPIGPIAPAALDALERACRELSARAARQPEAEPCAGDPDAASLAP